MAITSPSGFTAFTREVYVGRFAPRFAELLGLPEADLPPAKPQIYLTQEEARDGSQLLGPASGRRKIVVEFSTGGGPGRVWPTESFRALIGRLDRSGAWDIAHERKQSATMLHFWSRTLPG
jgi:ADP-heptose:LPS heptosyltransferase